MKIKKTIKRLILLLLFIAAIYGIYIGVKNSEFANLKNRNKSSTKSLKEIMAEFFHEGDNNYFTTKVTIKSDSVANLGDFEINISGDRKLVANISLKYYSYNKESKFNDDTSVKKEILKKDIILRDAAINTILGGTKIRADNDKMRENIRDALNKKLQNGQVKEVYFNKFIIQ